MISITVSVIPICDSNIYIIWLQYQTLCVETVFSQAMFGVSAFLSLKVTHTQGDCSNNWWIHFMIGFETLSAYKQPKAKDFLFFQECCWRNATGGNVHWALTEQAKSFFCNY